jgi:hypothetical protein
LDTFLRGRGDAPDARLFIYYAGHGFTQTSALHNAYRGFVTGIDAPYYGTDPAQARARALSMDLIREMVSDIQARHVLFMFDTCFGGAVFGSRSSEAVVVPLDNREMERLIETPFDSLSPQGRKMNRCHPVAQCQVFY